MKNKYLSFFIPIIITLIICISFIVTVNIRMDKYNKRQAEIEEENKIKEQDNPVIKEDTRKPVKNLLADKIGVGVSYVAPDFKANKLMIVAHPDDETLWGGMHLIEDDYAVICVTCGVVKKRELEFANVMDYSNEEYAMLGHTDLKNGYISDWTDEYQDIEKELTKIIDSKNWDIIVTHNPNGEYGHKHHRKINKIVTSNTNDKNKLYYFGKFYTQNDIGNIDSSTAFTGERLNKKIGMLKLYPSQGLPDTNPRYYQMYPYENWISYNNW